MIDFTDNRNDAIEFIKNKRMIEPVDYKSARKYRSGVHKGDVVDFIELIDSDGEGEIADLAQNMSKASFGCSSTSDVSMTEENSAKCVDQTSVTELGDINVISA